MTYHGSRASSVPLFPTKIRLSTSQFWQFINLYYPSSQHSAEFSPLDCFADYDERWRFLFLEENEILIL